MRILVDYRSALRTRTGAGEYIHEIVRAYTATYSDRVTIFTSSWKHRPAPGVAAELGADCVDRRVPVRVLNLLWHRLEWPPAEWLAGSADVVHAAHPLLIPARRAAQVVTIHDLFFLTASQRTRAEIRRDYPALAAAHARRADAIVTPSAYTTRLVAERFGVDPGRIYMCPPGAPGWRQLGRAPNQPADGYILFVGTLEPRKNVGVLLDAYARLVERVPRAPRLVLAGRATGAGAAWLERLRTSPFDVRARHLGYVPDQAREALYAGARVLVLPSLDEGFGLPVLEAMSAGVPVIASTAGALPEVVGEAGALIAPDDSDGLADALELLVRDPDLATARARAGLDRARAFTWTAAARALHRAYHDAIQRRRLR